LPAVTLAESSESTTSTVRWAGELLHLLPERALWWPAAGVLFVADLHLGKAATYRALGQPVPGGTTQENLARLDALIARWSPRRIVFLGDFLHAAQARTVLALETRPKR
jgi:metallophosphoesterase superfamily enzyme